MLHLQFSFLCSSSGRRFLALRSLLALRDLGFAAHRTRPHVAGYPDVHRATHSIASLPLQSLPLEILQHPSSSPHSSLNDAGHRSWER